MKRPPNSFNHGGVGYPRWIVLPVDAAGELKRGALAIIDARAFPESAVKRVARSLATSMGTHLGIVRELRSARGAKSNPTLVHHGVAQGAAWHLFTKAGAPLADLYVGENAARVISQALADHMRTPTHLVKNDYSGEYGRKDLRRSQAESPYHGETEIESVNRNPGVPAFGQVWRAPGGPSVRVLTVKDNRVQAVDLETGDRTWFDLLEFRSRFKRKPAVTQNAGKRRRAKASPRRAAKARKQPNPKSRNVRGSVPAVGSLWERIEYPKHLARVRSISRGARELDGEEATVVLDVITGRGAVMGETRLILGAFHGTYAPLPASSPYRKTIKANPRSETAKARKTFKMWHEFGATKVTRVKGPNRLPKTLVKLGDLISVTYRSDKYAGGPDNPRGKALLYEHKTKSPHPVLATDPEGKFVHIVGGRMKVTGDGLVN